LKEPAKGRLWTLALPGVRSTATWGGLQPSPEGTTGGSPAFIAFAYSQEEVPKREKFASRQDGGLKGRRQAGLPATQNAQADEPARSRLQPGLAAR